VDILLFELESLKGVKIGTVNSCCILYHCMLVWSVLKLTELRIS